MEKDKNRYLLVDGSKIIVDKHYIKKYESSLLKRIFAIREGHFDFEHADKYFEFNDVPVEFRKMFLILHEQFTSKINAEEFFTGESFDIFGSIKIEDDSGNNRLISGRTKTKINFNIYHISWRVAFDPHIPNFIDFEDIKNFYLLLKENNLLEKYINSMNDLFRTDYAIDEEKLETKVRKLEL